MKILWVIAFLIAFLPSSLAQQCDVQPNKIVSMKPDFGGISGFYGIAKGISDGLQSTPDSKTYNDLNDLIFGNGAVTYDQVIKDMVVNQIGAIIFWSVGFVFVLAALVLAIATCIWQCCYSCVPKETSTRSEITGYVYASLLFAAFCFILTGIILFNISETDLIDSIDNGVVYTSQISGDLATVIANGTGQIVCEVNSTTSQTFSAMNVLIGSYAAVVVNGTENKVGLTAVNSFDYMAFGTQNNITIDDATALGNAIAMDNSAEATCQKNKNILANQFLTVIATLNALSKLSMEIPTSKEVTDLNQQIADIQKQISQQATQASKAINASQDQITQSVQSITNMLDNIQNEINTVMNSIKRAHNDLTTSGAYSAITLGIRLEVTIPTCFACCFCILAFVAVVFSLRQQDGLALKLSGAVLSTFYTVLTTTIIILLTASLLYVGGWFTSAMCVPIFEDPNYQLFRLMNQTIQPVNGNGTPDVVNIGEVLYTCNDETVTLYTAINGSTVISADSISQSLNLDSFRKSADDEIASQPTVNFTVPPVLQPHVDDLNKYTEEAKNSDLSTCNNNDLTQKYQKYIENLQKSNALSQQFYQNLVTLSQNTPNTTLIAREQNDAQFTQGDASINQSISNLMTNLQTKVFMCRPLVDIYNNGGAVMCERFGKPVQGLWASVGLAGIFLFVLSILLLLTFRWLKTNSTKTSQKSGGNWDSSYGSGKKGSRKLGDKKKNKTSTGEEEDIFARPYINSTSNTGRGLHRIRPLEMTESPTDMYESSNSYMPRVQVLPDSRHPPMSPQFFDTTDYVERNPQFNNIDLFGGDLNSQNGSTQRGLRRM